MCKQMRLNVRSILGTSQSPYSPIVDAPIDSNCTPPQVVRHSYPLCPQISPNTNDEKMSHHGHPSHVGYIGHHDAVNATTLSTPRTAAADQNVFRQRNPQMIITPPKEFSHAKTSASLTVNSLSSAKDSLQIQQEPDQQPQQHQHHTNTNVCEDSPWVTLKQYQSAPDQQQSGQQQTQAHRRVISSSTAPTAAHILSKSNSNLSSPPEGGSGSGSGIVALNMDEVPSMISLTNNPTKEMVATNTNTASATTADSETIPTNRPLLSSSSSSSSQVLAAVAPTTHKLQLSSQTAIPPPALPSFGVRSTRGRSRSHYGPLSTRSTITASSTSSGSFPSSPPTLQDSKRDDNAHRKKNFTVSSRGGFASKQRIHTTTNNSSMRATKHVYMSSSPSKIHDMYNLQMFRHPTTTSNGNSKPPIPSMQLEQQQQQQQNQNAQLPPSSSTSSPLIYPSSTNNQQHHYHHYARPTSPSLMMTALSNNNIPNTHVRPRQEDMYNVHNRNININPNNNNSSSYVVDAIAVSRKTKRARTSL